MNGAFVISYLLFIFIDYSHPRISKRQASNAAFMALFTSCDSDRDGKIGKHELEEAFRRMNAPQDQIEKVIKQLDLNGDGVVTLGEYKVALGMTYEPVEAWAQLFKELDTDRSGDISREELQAVFEESGISVLKEAIEEWINEHDRNGDGKLNYQEFMTFVGQQAEKPDSFF
ncbi:Calcium-binding protein [Fasciolopsis buskii]|uniref:Calcium-binding protein n=1 Tax=Fasciolopsis buskii TaxID=27845 RepID=A0A8E0RTG9_9TREM|nr:Calcium-binding protein [Fasciolopsis buski]